MTPRTIFIVGENLIDYPGDVIIPASQLTNMKIHVKSAISDVKSRYMCVDVKDFYLNNMMVSVRAKAICDVNSRA